MSATPPSPPPSSPSPSSSPKGRASRPPTADATDRGGESIAASPPFTWSGDEIRRVGHRVVEMIANHLTGIPDGPVFRPVPGSMTAALVATAPPRLGEPVDAVLDRFAAEIAPYPFGNGHPRFYGWVNSPPAVIGVFADALAAAMNPSVAGGNHAAVWIERQVIEWFKQMLGFPAGSMGVLVSGGSAAAITALAVARHVACASRGWDVRAEGVQGEGRAARLVVYQGTEGHACNQKAVELLGIGSAHLRKVPSDAGLRMLPEALDAMLHADVAAGHVPVAVVASAGTVNTGAVDPLDALAHVCQRHGVWLHVDGAYGAPAILTEEYREALVALGRADSVAVDPHKWLYVPVDAGLVLLRNGHAMRDALSLVPPYIRTDDNVHGVQGPPWLSEYSLEQTRPFRALKVWAALRHFGTDGYRTMIAHDLAMARHLADQVRATPGFELREPQGLSVVCFRALPEAGHWRGTEETLTILNRAVLNDVQLGGAGFLSSTVIDGRFWLRACIVNPRATAADIDAVFAAVRSGVERAAREPPSGSPIN